MASLVSSPQSQSSQHPGNVQFLRPPVREVGDCDSCRRFPLKSMCCRASLMQDERLSSNYLAPCNVLNVGSGLCCRFLTSPKHWASPLCAVRRSRPSLSSLACCSWVLLWPIAGEHCSLCIFVTTILIVCAVVLHGFIA